MPKYKILFHGKNLYANIDGKMEKVSFYTTRVVDAHTSVAAEIKAHQALEEEAKVKELISNCRDQSPMFSVEEMEELDANEIEFERTGLVFYVDDDS